MAIRNIPLSIACSLASFALVPSMVSAQTSVAKSTGRPDTASRTSSRTGTASQDRMLVSVAVRPRTASPQTPPENKAAAPVLTQPITQADQAQVPPAEAASDANRGTLTPLAMEGVRTPIRAANILPSDIGTRILPEDEAAKLAHPVAPLPGGAERGWGFVDYRWQASNVYHWPLYFEDPMLERHGQHRTPQCVQPAVSGAKFFGNVALYPYRAALWPAFESRYTLGHFRPGSSAPVLRDTVPWSPRAALYQGAAVTGVVVGLPWKP